jgi:anaerobic magnesium-protoporphyrin IX monomethyl ester cyclase
MKVCLVFPRFKYVTGDPPLGLAYIAAYIRHRADVFIIDATFNPSLNYVRDNLQRIKPEIVGIYSDTIMYNDAVNVAKMAREQHSLVVMGGPHASAMPETFLEAVNIVVAGEGELAMLKIIKDYPWLKTNHIAHIWQGSLYKNLDYLPLPARDLLDMKGYMKHWYYLDSVNANLRGTSLVASRGCPYRCSFCYPGLRRIFGDRVRERSAENVIAEIEHLMLHYNVNSLFFHDDTFTLRKNWIYRFCDLLESRAPGLLWACNTRADTMDEELMVRMRQVGLRCIHLGIESGSQRILDKVYHKGITLEQVHSVCEMARKHKISVLGFFMLGAPGERMGEAEATIRLARSLPIQEATFSITCPLPGTALYDTMLQEHRLSPNFADYNYYSRRPFEDGELNLHRLKQMQRWALLTFYLHPRRWGYIARHIRSWAGIKKMLTKIRRFS